MKPILPKPIDADPALAAFRETTGNSIGIIRKLYFALATIVAFGVVYNSARARKIPRGRSSSPGWREQPVALQEFQQQAVEQPGLLHVAGMARTGKHMQFAARNLLLQGKCQRVRGVFAAGKYQAGALDLAKLRGSQGLEGFELADDGLKV